MFLGISDSPDRRLPAPAPPLFYIMHRMRFEHQTPRDEDALLAAGEDTGDPDPPDEEFTLDKVTDEGEIGDDKGETGVEGDPPDTDFALEREQERQRELYN
jgi:hypothetical protein